MKFKQLTRALIDVNASSILNSRCYLVLACILVLSLRNFTMSSLQFMLRLLFICSSFLSTKTNGGTVVYTMCDDTECCTNCRVSRSVTVPFDGECRWNGFQGERHTCYNLEYKKSVYTTPDCSGDQYMTLTSGQCYTMLGRMSYFLECRNHDIAKLKTNNDDISNHDGERNVENVYVISIILILLAFLAGVIGGYLVYSKCCSDKKGIQAIAVKI